jgi:Tol biopolymer transport system component
MKRASWLFCLLVMTGMNVFSQQDRFPKLTGPFLGQTPPGMTPELFALGIVSTGLHELNSVFSPDGREFYFCVRTMASSTLFVMKRHGDVWGKPGVLPFNSPYNDIDVTISPDGKRLFFCSNRPLSGTGDPKGDYDIWMCERQGDTWGKPIHLGDTVNSDRDDFYPVFTKKGTLFFNSQRAGQGTNDIYQAKWSDGKFLQAEKLGLEINTEFREFDAFVSPDEDFIIFASDRQGNNGDLFASFKTGDGNWTVPVNMGTEINGSGPEFCPVLSPDGKYFFFTKGTMPVYAPGGKPKTYHDYVESLNGPDNASTNIWWVSSEVIEVLRPKKTE